MSLRVTVDRPLAHRIYDRLYYPANAPLDGVYLLSSESVNGWLSLEIGLHPEIGFLLIARVWQRGRHVRHEIEADYLLGERLPGYNPNFADGRLAWMEQQMADICSRTEETEAKVLACLGLTLENL